MHICDLISRVLLSPLPITCYSLNKLKTCLTIKTKLHQVVVFLIQLHSHDHFTTTLITPQSRREFGCHLQYQHHQRCHQLVKFVYSPHLELLSPPNTSTNVYLKNIQKSIPSFIEGHTSNSHAPLITFQLHSRHYNANQSTAAPTADPTNIVKSLLIINVAPLLDLSIVAGSPFDPPPPPGDGAPPASSPSGA